MKTFVGLKLEIIDGDGVGGYSSVWNTAPGTAWQSWHGMTNSQYIAKLQELASQNYKLTYISGYAYAGETRYAGIWEYNQNGDSWNSHHDIDQTTLQQYLSQYANLGLQLTHINSYQSNGNILYAAIWGSNVQQNNVEAELSWLGFNNTLENYHNTGFQIKHVTAASKNSQSFFLGVWENQGIWQEPDLNHISDTVTNFMSNFNVPGASLALVKDGRLVYAKGFGVMDKTTKDPVGSKSLFRIASVSKPITSATLMTIIENDPSLLASTIFGPNGILGTEYGTVPYSENEKDLTLEQLLEHTAAGTVWSNTGGNDPMFWHTNYNFKQLIDWVLDTRDPDYLPGQHYAYSNFGYCLLGRVIEKLSGIDYESYVQENVLKQCGINDMHTGGNLESDKRQSHSYLKPKS